MSYKSGGASNIRIVPYKIPSHLKVYMIVSDIIFIIYSWFWNVPKWHEWRSRNFHVFSQKLQFILLFIHRDLFRKIYPKKKNFCESFCQNFCVFWPRESFRSWLVPSGSGSCEIKTQKWRHENLSVHRERERERERK